MGLVWSSAHRPSTETWASAKAVAATVSSAKVPMSALAVKGHISCWKPIVSKNVERGTLQIMQITNAQPALGHVCSVAAGTSVTSVTMGSF